MCRAPQFCQHDSSKDNSLPRLALSARPWGQRASGCPEPHPPGPLTAISADSPQLSGLCTGDLRPLFPGLSGPPYGHLDPRPDPRPLETLCPTWESKPASSREARTWGARPLLPWRVGGSRRVGLGPRRAH